MRLDSLRKRADFLRVQASPHRFSRPAFLLTCLPLPAIAEGEVCVGYTATKKLGNAVIRNRIKRRLRAASRPLLAAQGQGGCAYVWIARKPAETMDHAEMAAEMAWALKRAHGFLASARHKQRLIAARPEASLSEAPEA